MANNNRNSYVAQQESNLQVSNPMENFKTEVAAEIGLQNYNSMDKGWLASRQNGYVGGNMTRKLVLYSQQIMAEQGHQIMQSVAGAVDVSPEVRHLNEMASQNFNGFVQALQGGMGYQELGMQGQAQITNTQGFVQ